MGWVLAVDIGGTKMAVAAVDASGREVVPARSCPTPAHDGEGMWQALAALVDGVVAAAADAGLGPAAACGVGCGGPMRAAAGTVSPLNIPGWRDFPLVERLGASTGL